MQYLLFSFWFIVIHTASYTIAGAAALRFSGDLYRGKDRLYDFHRDMDDPSESKHVQKWFLPAQLLRGLLFSVVLYPALGVLSGLSFPLAFLFVFGLLFVFNDMGCANPFPHNIEGMVYMRDRYLRKRKLWKLYFETFVYALLGGLGVAWLIT